MSGSCHSPIPWDGDPASLMQQALAVAREGLAAGQSPFGCAIAHNGLIIARRHNTVLADSDVTAHAEINALRTACRALDNYRLEGAIVATTCEPCPMCTGALHWAHVAHVYYGAAIADATAAGFGELHVPCAELLRLGGSPVQLSGPLLLAECQALFAQWQSDPARQCY